MNAAEFARSVEADARRAGMPADVAAALARQVGKRPPPSVAAPSHRASAARAQHASGAQSPRSVNVDRLCALYGAQVLAPDFRAARGIPLRAFTALLNAAVGARAKITPAGIEHVRIALMARGAA